MKAKLLGGEIITVSLSKTDVLKRNTVLNLTLSLHDMQSLIELEPTELKEKMRVLTRKFKKLV